MILFDWWSGLVILGNSHTLTHTHSHSHSLSFLTVLFILSCVLICRQSFHEVLNIDLQEHGSLIDEKTGAELQETWAILSSTYSLAYSYTHLIDTLTRPSHSFTQLELTHSLTSVVSFSSVYCTCSHTQLTCQRRDHSTSVYAHEGT